MRLKVPKISKFVKKPLTVPECSGIISLALNERSRCESIVPEQLKSGKETKVKRDLSVK